MRRILVIDDSPSLIASLREIFEREGFGVDELTSFLDLPDLLRTTPPDLIILDLEMPMMPGKMAAQYIRKYQEGSRAIPILIHSSMPVEDLQRAVADTGAVGYVQKGSSQERLLEVARLHSGKR